MSVKAVGPRADPPFVPKYLVLAGGTTVELGLSRRVPLERDDYPLPELVDLPPNGWVGVAGTGGGEAFDRSKEGPWRAVEAERSVTLAYTMVKEDPIRAASLIRGAAALVGLSVPALVQALEAQRLPGETLEAVFDRVKRPAG